MLWEKDLQIKQVDDQISRIMPSANTQKPKVGWLNLIRTTLGMSARILGKRIGLSQSRIALIEKGEIDGTITLHTLEKVAEGLNCKLVYFLVPNGATSLSSIREQQAYKKASKLDAYAEHQMRLEDQATSAHFQKKNVNKFKEEYLKNWPRDFWEE